MKFTRPKTRLVVRATSATVLFATSLGLAAAQTRPSLNLYGASGLIDMPSGEAQPDGALTGSTTHFGPVSRTTLSFQITPKLSGSFRFSGVRDWNSSVRSQFATYYDRSFDLRYQLFDEGQYRPAVTVGLQDFVGTGVLAGEYVAATKHLTPDLKVSAGLGWGRLGSYNSIGTPFGVRPVLDAGHGGNFNFGQWFRGAAAPFGGVEWQINDKLTFKAEYSSDDYTVESGLRKTFEKRSPLNFGLEYQRGENIRLGAYYMYGSEVGIGAHFLLNPKGRAGGGIVGPAPDTVEPRPSRAADPEAWSTEWTMQEDVGNILYINLTKRLKTDGVEVLSATFDGRVANVRIRNAGNDAEAQAIGRTARALTHVMPASVEQFDIVSVANGMPVSTVSIRRSDLEKLEFDTDATAKMQNLVAISAAPTRLEPGAADAAAYPRLTWSVGPFARFRLFDQNSPFKAGAGLKLNAKYEMTPGLILSGSVTKLLASNLNDRPPLPARALQPVRSANYFYDKEGDPAIESLQLAYYHKLAPEIYGRISVGYLERMFGGISSEVLYMPTDGRWAIGAEVNYVAQRAPNQQFSFTLPASMYQTDFCGSGSLPACKTNSSYRVLTGHISGYYAFDHGFHGELDVGRYLAGDIGATLSLKREFSNGWKVGAFVTKTNVSAADYGSGSFDKGISIEVPLAALTGTASRQTQSSQLRPFGRDGGQRLEVEGRLYDTVRDYRASGLTEQWGRFWK